LEEINEKKSKKLKKMIENKEILGQRVANKILLKSRGIYRKRKQYQGNAKLVLREKFFKKTKIRNRYVKEFKEKPLVYKGQVTGIRDDLIRGTKLY